MNIPKYLEDNASRIKQLGEQELNEWSSSYEAEGFNKFKIIEEIKETFPSKRIYRSDIIKMFQNNKIYLGFVTAMMWGGINATRPHKKAGGVTETNFYKILSYKKESIEESIIFSNKCFEEGDFKTPFKQMMPSNKYKIPGVGYPYFTKIFFFLGQSNDHIKIKPLILDKWTSNSFYALLSQSYPEDIPKFFRTIKSSKNTNSPGEVVLRSGKNLINAYERFNHLMNDWAQQLNISPDKLEEFVFGYRLDSGDRASNPRVQLWQIVDNNKNLVSK